MGKEGVVTVRDLIKWSKREITTKEELAYEGYIFMRKVCHFGRKIKSSRGTTPDLENHREIIQYYFRSQKLLQRILQKTVSLGKLVWQYSSKFEF